MKLKPKKGYVISAEEVNYEISEAIIANTILLNHLQSVNFGFL
jgi:hypothetical protein